MQEVTIYEAPYTLTLLQESGSTSLVELPGVAEIDATFLLTWLHGKSEKTVRAYTANIHRLYTHTGKSLQQLTLEDFQGFINSLVHLKPRSRSQMIAAVKSALS